MNRLALRNLFRHRVRSLVTLGAIAFSTIVLVVAAGFIEWIFVDLRKSLIETGLGHVQVMRAGYLEKGVADPFSYLLSDTAPERASIEGMPHVVSVGRRLDLSGLISLGDSTLSFVGVGVEPGKEARITRNLEFLSGSDLDDASTDEIVVGQGLAANLRLKTGDRVVLLVSSSKGGTGAAEATIRGVFSTQVRAFDEVAVRMPLSIAKRLLKVQGAHKWVVALDDVDRVDDTAQAIAALDAKPALEVKRWIDLSDFYTKTVRFLSGQLGAMRFLIAVIIVLGVTNMLIMNVLERTGEIGTLMALGARRRKVVALFVTESVYLGLIGGLAGVVLAIVIAKLISAIGAPLPPPPGRTAGYLGAILVSGPILFSGFAVSLVTTVLAGIYPARKASRLVIVDALRHNR